MAFFEIEHDGQVFDVEAPDEASALAALDEELSGVAPATQAAGGQLSREDRLARIAELEAELKSVQENRMGRPEALGRSIIQAGATAVGGIAGAVNEIGQAANDLGISPGSLVGNFRSPQHQAALAEEFQNREDAIRTGTNLLNQQVAENAYGRPLSEPERQSIDDISERGQSIGKFTTQVGAALATGGATFGSAKAGGALILGSLEGALTGAILSNSDKTTTLERRAERLGQMKMGAALGGIFGIVPAALTAGKNFLAGQVRKYSEHADEGFDLAAEFGIPITFGQASGSPLIQNVERAAQGQQAQNLLREQAETFAAKLGQRLGIRVRPLDDVGEGLGASVTETTNRVSRLIGAQKAARNAEWKSTLNRADEAAGGAGLYRPMDFLRQLRGVVDDITETYGGKLQPGKPMANLLKEVEAAVTGKGATARQLSRWMTQVSDWKGTARGVLDDADGLVRDGVYDKQAQVFAGRLSHSLGNSIDSMGGATAGTPVGDAINLVRSARSNFRTASDSIRTVEREFMGALGMVGGTPQQILNRLGQADPAVVRTAMRALDNMDGGAVFRQQLREAMFEQAVQAGMQGAIRKGFATGAMDVGSFAESFATTSRRSTLSGIQTAAEERTARQGIDLARRILNDPAAASPTGVVKTTLPFGLQEIAINAISRNPGFLARLVAGGVTRGKGAEWLFFHPGGIKTLRSMDKIRVRTPRLNSARNTGIVSLLGMMQADVPEEKRPDE